MTRLARFRSPLICTGMILLPVLVLCVLAHSHATSLAPFAHLAYAAPLGGGLAFALTAPALPVFDSQDAVPEQFRSLYVEKEGKWQPNLPDVAAPLKAKNKELLDQLAKAKAKADVFGDDRTPDEIKADLEYAAKKREEEARAGGQLDDWKKQLEAKSAKEIAAKSAELEVANATVYDLVARQALSAAIVAGGGNPKLLLPHMLPSVKVVKQDGKFVAQVTEGAETLAELVERFKADESFGAAFAASGASGTGGRNEQLGGGGGSGAKVIIPKDASPQEYRRLKADAEKRGVPYAVAT